MCDHGSDKEQTLIPDLGGEYSIYMCECGALVDALTERNRGVEAHEPMYADELIAVLQVGTDELRKKLADMEERRDAAYQAYVATDTNLAACKRDLTQLRQGLANLLV